MTARTVFIRQGVQAEEPEADVVPEYGAYAVATGEVTPLPWMQEFVSTPAMPALPVRHLPAGQQPTAGGW